jgi:hypothetical protein
VEIIKYREASKEGIVVKSKISWHNKRRQRGEIKSIVTQQKIGIVVKT